MRTWPRTDGRTALRTIDRTSVGLPSDPFFSSTTLLLPGNGTNGAQNNTFLDSSTNNFTITRNGNTTQGTFSPFPPASGTAYSAAANGGSGSFDGNGDYLGVADGTALDLNTTFTVEGWFYQSAAGDAVIFNRGGGDASWSAVNGHEYMLVVLSGSLRWDFNTSGSVTSISTTAPAAGAWHHVAVGYNGTTTRVWLNGVSVGTSAAAYTLPTTRNLTRVGYAVSNSTYFTGYISSLRIVKGTDVYGVGNTSITVPTAPLTAITNTSLLLNFTNAGVLDATAKNNLETVGNAQISTAQSKWNGASIAFDGTGDWLLVPAGQNWEFGSGDFTVEMWLNPSSTTTTDAVISKGNASSTGNEVWTLQWGSANKLEFYSGGGLASPIVTSTTAFSTGAWYHVAVTRASGTTRIFVGGALEASSVTSYTVSVGGALYVAAGWFAPSSRDTSGYIDDLRITKGVARYTAAFTAPIAPFPLR
jgi:hypothetical protein